MNNARARRGILWLATLILVIATAASAAEPRLIAAVFVKGKVGLKWQTVEGVDEYSVYRKTGSGDFEVVHTTGQGQWFDEAITPGETYVYRIGAKSDGAEAFSTEKSVTIPGQVGGFKAPTWVGARIEGPRIMLNWDPVPNGIAYNVFRSETKGGPYESIGSSQTSRYADNANLTQGATYYYVLTALNAEFEETPESEELEVKFGKSKAEVEAEIEALNAVVLTPLNLTELGWLEKAGNETMAMPGDVFQAPSGDLYITDMNNRKVRCFDSKGDYKFSFGEKSPGARNGKHPQGTFLLPLTLFIDAAGTVYVTDDQRGDIQVFDAKGNFQRVIEFTVDEGMKQVRPHGLHVYADGRLLVSDMANHRLMICDADGNVLSSWGKNGGAEGDFNFPDELVVDGKGQIHVVDVMNFRVQTFGPDGKFIRSFGGAGQHAGTFGRPQGIAVGQDGSLWITDALSNMVQKFSTNGEVLSAIGTSDDAWRFDSPRGIYVTNEKVFIVSRFNNRVGMFALN